jgi:hypothetical protein
MRGGACSTFTSPSVTVSSAFSREIVRRLNFVPIASNWRLAAAT